MRARVTTRHDKQSRKTAPTTITQQRRREQCCQCTLFFDASFVVVCSKNCQNCLPNDQTFKLDRVFGAHERCCCVHRRWDSKTGWFSATIQAAGNERTKRVHTVPTSTLDVVHAADGAQILAEREEHQSRASRTTHNSDCLATHFLREHCGPLRAASASLASIQKFSSA